MPRTGWLTGENNALGYVRRVLLIPNDQGLRTAVTGAILELTYAHNWEQYGTLTPDECAEVFQYVLSQFLIEEECP